MWGVDHYHGLWLTNAYNFEGVTQMKKETA